MYQSIIYHVACMYHSIIYHPYNNMHVFMPSIHYVISLCRINIIYFSQVIYRLRQLHITALHIVVLNTLSSFIAQWRGVSTERFVPTLSAARNIWEQHCPATYLSWRA